MSVTLPRIVGGAIIVEAFCYRATKTNQHLNLLPVVGGSVSVDTTAATPMTFQGQLSGADLLQPWDDWIAPMIEITTPRPDGNGDRVERQQIGLFQVQPAQKTYSAASSRFSIDGRDPTWVLADYSIDKPYTIAAGTNLKSALIALLSLGGLTRHLIDATSKTMPRTKTYDMPQTLLEIANDLCKRAGWVPLHADRIGRIRGLRWRKLGDVAPARTISSAAGDVLRTVTLDPDVARLCNRVIVVGSNPDGDPVIAKRLNNDPKHPASTKRRALKTKYVEDNALEDQDAVDQMADRLIEQGASAIQRMQVTTLPYVTWNLHDVIACDIANERGEEVASGKWRWTKLEQGFGLQGRTTWTLEKQLPWMELL